jgi:hypothetical protein
VLLAKIGLGFAEICAGLCGLGHVDMTRTKTLAAAAAVLSITLIAAGATFRDTHPVAQSSTETDFDERWISTRKGDRLPLVTPTPLDAAPAQTEVAPPVAPATLQLPRATEDDIRQADAEHHRHRDICPRGRTYFTIERHRYWRCKL